MNNYNKIGYSVSEVAQIFGCTPATVRRYIYEGHLKADVSFANKRNNIRIRREHLIEYMTKHQSRFTDVLLKQFGIAEADTEENHDSTSVDFAPRAYTARDVSELKGAWGNHDTQNANNTKVQYSKHGAASVSLNRTTEKKFPAYDIIADGKVVISGCEKLTVGKIVDALITDRQLDIKEISIKKK